MMHEVAEAVAAAVVDRLLERVQDEVGAQRRRDPPADDPPGEDVDDERDVDEATPGGDVGKVGDPELIRPGRGEAPLDQIGRPRSGGIGLAVSERKDSRHQGAPCAVR